MRHKLIINSHTTEIISSLLRWFFVFFCLAIVFYEPLADHFNARLKDFLPLLIFGITYMGLTQIILHCYSEKSKIYYYFTRSGVVFDIIATFWFMELTGGAHSPFFPIFYLITIHAALYWFLQGALIAASGIFLGYALFLISNNYYFYDQALFAFILNSIFLFLISFYGGIIASRERKYYREKRLYQNQANRDFLTGLYNHRYFQETLTKCLKNKKAFHLILLDIDHFKNVNDQYGHVIGDKVLQDISRMFVKNSLLKKGMVFRYGGEEFAIIVKTSSFDEVNQYIKTIYHELQKMWFHCNSTRFQVTLSFGITAFGNEEASNTVVERADELLYLAKRQGRNRALYAKNLSDDIVTVIKNEAG